MAIPINKNNGDILTASEFNAISQAISGDKLPYDPNTGEPIDNTYGIGSPDYKIKNINGENVANYKSIIGEIKFGMWKSDQVPDYHVGLYGQIVSRETYSNLFTHLINHNVYVYPYYVHGYGLSTATRIEDSGDGSTTFHLPNFCSGSGGGRFVKCVQTNQSTDSDIQVLGVSEYDQTRKPRTSSFTGVTSTNGEHTHNIFTSGNGMGHGAVFGAYDHGAGAYGEETTYAAGNHSHTVQITNGGDGYTQPNCINVSAIIYAGV